MILFGVYKAFCVKLWRIILKIVGWHMSHVVLFSALSLCLYLRYDYYSYTFLLLFLIVITFLFWNNLITVMYYVNPGSSTGEICPVERSRNCSHGKNLCGGRCWKSSVKSKVRQFLYICVFVHTQRRFLSVIIIRMYLSLFIYLYTHTHDQKVKDFWLSGEIYGVHATAMLHGESRAFK